jgi:valyl-tRNA synthetase
LSKPILLTTDSELADAGPLVTRLSRAGELRLVKQGSGLYLGTTTPAWIEATTEQVAARRHHLQQQQTEKRSYLKGLEARLANSNYVKSAPSHIVQDTRDRQSETKQLLGKLDEQLAALETK